MAVKPQVVINLLHHDIHLMELFRSERCGYPFNERYSWPGRKSPWTSKIQGKSKNVASSIFGRVISIDKSGHQCECTHRFKHPGRHSTMNPDEVMYGDHRPRVSRENGVFCYKMMELPEG
jgi:hypothetical protein